MHDEAEKGESAASLLTAEEGDYGPMHWLWALLTTVVLQNMQLTMNTTSLTQ